jgi:Primase C terminal 1 (PriCT-1)
MLILMLSIFRLLSLFLQRKLVADLPPYGRHNTVFRILREFAGYRVYSEQNLARIGLVFAPYTQRTRAEMF